jgi:hypothetical protein
MGDAWHMLRGSAMESARCVGSLRTDRRFVVVCVILFARSKAMNATLAQWAKAIFKLLYGNQDRPPYTVTDLDNVLTKCKTKRMIPILGLWDLTCNNNPSLLNSQLISWWTTNPVLTILKKHQQYLIINLANELGVYRWAGDNATQQATALTDVPVQVVKT